MNKIQPILFQDQPISFEEVKKSWKEAFSRDLSIQYWHWRFENNPYEQQIKAAYIIEENTVAAFYAVSPCLIELSDHQVVKAGLMNMGFTHPRFQGNGYYLKINQLLHEQLIKEDYVCCFGFANHNSHYPYRKYLGWKDLSILTNFERMYTNRFINNHVFDEADYSINRVNSENILAIAEYTVGSENRFFVRRDNNFMQWRIVRNPMHDYYILKTQTKSIADIGIVYKIYQNESVDIMEIFVREEKAIDKRVIYTALINALDFLQNKYKIKLSLWSNLYSEEHLQLEKAGFRENAFSTYFGIQNFTKDSELERISNWHYRFIDSDIY